MLYAHTREDDYFNMNATFALTPPTKADLHELFQVHGTQTLMLYGVSVCSKHDNFNKKKGRELAEARVVPRLVELRDIKIHGTKHVYRFKSEIEVGHIKYVSYFELTTIAESEVVKLIKCQVGIQ